MNDNFARFKRKIFFQVIMIALGVPIVGILIKSLLVDGLLQDSFAEGMIQFCMETFRLTHSEGMSIYQHLFRNYKTEWMALGLFILLLIAFYFAFARMTRYFRELSEGLDRLVGDASGEITLSPEMDFMAAKLNRIKAVLELREREAREAEQRKNDLVVYLAHDIKTPLTSVIGYLSLLNEAPEMPPEQKARYIGITLEKAYRLEQLIDEFFEITRFNLQAIVLSSENINLTFMLQQLADEFYPILNPRGNQVVVKAGNDLIVWGDPDKLARVFNNILKNAINYSYENSIIEIIARQNHNRTIISFVNQGKAIPRQKLDTIFEKFFRLDSARSTTTGGAGLGLAIAREIVVAHHGTISAVSENDHTNFTVVLPTTNPELRKP